jgi:hypothetical protein
MAASEGYGSIESAPGHELELESQSSTLPSSLPKKFWRLPPKKVLAAIGIVVAGCIFIWYPRRLRYHSPHPVATNTAYVKSDPSHALFYHDQLVDHYDDSKRAPDTFSQRYYESLDYFAGPGSPFFVILGGEDTLTKILYPFISQTLAQQFGAYTINIEHRFYGKSYPLTTNPSNADLRRLLTPDQAMLDFVRLIRHQQKALGCGPRGTPTYCPVMTIGGSYPGFLSALMRLVHSDTVDIGYASSAPLHLYSHNVDQGAYYEKITQVAEQASPGCHGAVHEALMAAQAHILEHGKDDKTNNSDDDTVSTIASLAEHFGICTKTIPPYITSRTLLSQEIMMVVANHFADNNMAYYPPSPDKDLVRGCQVFQNLDNWTSSEKLEAFLKMGMDIENDDDPKTKCFDLVSELPPGPKGTISAADWSGVGDGHSGAYWVCVCLFVFCLFSHYFVCSGLGLMWDFQSCSLIPECGMSEASMFPNRIWTLEWLTNHCQERFGVTPHRMALVNEYGFDDLTRASRLLFTNGIHDGWSVASILTNVSESVVAVNMINGAHHSDLTHEGPSAKDTDDVKQAHKQISAIIGKWLSAVEDEGMGSK